MTTKRTETPGPGNIIDQRSATIEDLEVEAAGFKRDTARFDKLERLAARCTSGHIYWRVNHVGEIERQSIVQPDGAGGWRTTLRGAIDAVPEPRENTSAK